MIFIVILPSITQHVSLSTAHQQSSNIVLKRLHYGQPSKGEKTEAGKRQMLWHSNNLYYGHQSIVIHRTSRHYDMCYCDTEAECHKHHQFVFYWGQISCQQPPVSTARYRNETQKVIHFSAEDC